jgi:hypothetical protein
MAHAIGSTLPSPREATASYPEASHHQTWSKESRATTLLGRTGFPANYLCDGETRRGGEEWQCCETLVTLGRMTRGSKHFFPLVYTRQVL